MACSCQKNKGGAAAKSKSYTVTAPDKTTKAYRTEVEAAAAAKRVGGSYKPA